jgi:uncharacterized membrane protein
MKGGEAVSPTHEDPLVADLSQVAGGPLGEHAGRHPWWTPTRVVLVLTAICFALGMVQKSPCYQATWQNGDTRFSQMCYSDLPYLYTGRGLAELEWPYTHDPQVRARYPEVMEYPVLISYWAYGTAVVTHWVSGSPDLAPRGDINPAGVYSLPGIPAEVRIFVLVNALGFALLALLSAWLLAGVDRRRPWDAAVFALSPALALSGLVNWDLLAVVFVAGAMWAWSRDRVLLTGVLIGLGTAAKLYPLFLLGGLLIICLRRRRLSDFGSLSYAAGIAWLLANLPGYVSGVEEWKYFWKFNSARGADLGSVWLMLQQMTDHAFSPHTINVWSWIIFGAWCLGVLALGLRTRGTGSLAQYGFLIVAGFLLVNKVYSPQYVLWLLPLAALARPRWRDQLIWQAGEVLYFAGVWWYLGKYLDNGGETQAGFYWIFIIVRVFAELYLVARVVGDLWGLPRDPQPSESGEDDLVERGGGVPDADPDLVTDGRHARA